MDTSGAFNAINTLYESKIHIWAHSITTYANYLIGALALIEVVWATIWWTLKGQEIDSLLATILKQIIIIGLFYTLILNGGTWLPALINSFSKIGEKAGIIVTLDPSSIFDQGLFMANEIFAAGMEMGIITHTFGALMSIALALTIVISYVLICADLVVTLVKIYITFAVSSIFFAFGVNAVTSPMSKNMIQSLIGLGLKLMGLYVIIGIGCSMANQWHMYLVSAKDSDAYYISWLTVAGACLIFYMLAKNVPPYLSTFAGVGAMMTHGGEFGAAMMAGAAYAHNASSRGYHAGAGIMQAGIGAAQTGAGVVQSVPGVAKTVYGAAMTVAGAATMNPASMASGISSVSSGIKDVGNKAGKNLVSGAKNMTHGTKRTVSGKKSGSISREKSGIKTL